MKRIILTACVLTALSLIFSSCDQKDLDPTNVLPDRPVLKSGTESNYVELVNVTDGIWIHTTYEEYNGKRTGSNGMVIETTDGLVLIDTPWNNEQTRELLKFTKSKFKKDFSLAIITHAHSDRIGGIDALLEKGIDVRSTPLTADIAERNGYGRPAPSLESDMNIRVGGLNLNVFYPGEGHSPDNIVVWLPEKKLLFAGCLIKALESETLGKNADTNMEQWPLSIENAMKKYPHPDIVIPGHGIWGGEELLEHTLELFKSN